MRENRRASRYGGVAQHSLGDVLAVAVGVPVVVAAVLVAVSYPVIAAAVATGAGVALAVSRLRERIGGGSTVCGVDTTGEGGTDPALAGTGRHSS
ncbi:hypothetical protein [Halapricum hydrolyticum]|uniref:Uncharacterized protein n=1 Tax=Halapricum hydrolyticum TaxID=2979991 RepID=A0AAE3LH45_9EURY|nr:hypothetical protein [Halapricum hydrolyticum]MCU4717390.1 hypothetical protein [Halapricum hydrolyticum]MCU4726554.1 hypothetical protein [Halapricum hydrolyticum]